MWTMIDRMIRGCLIGGFLMLLIGGALALALGLEYSSWKQWLFAIFGMILGAYYGQREVKKERRAALDPKNKPVPLPYAIIYAPAEGPIIGLADWGWVEMSPQIGADGVRYWTDHYSETHWKPDWWYPVPPKMPSTHTGDVKTATTLIPD